MPDSKLKTLRYWLEYAGLRFVGAAYGAMPVEFASAFCGMTWRIIAPLTYRHKRMLANLARAYPDKSEAEREKIARDSWENLGRTFAEAFHLKRIINSDRITIVDAELLDRVRETIRRTGQGAVFCAGHLGNWELSAVAMVKHGIGPATVYQRIKNPYVERYTVDLRSILFPAGIYRKDRTVVRTLTKHALGGGVVGFLTDLREFGGIKIDFFGALAPTAPFPAHLAHFLDLPLYVLTIERRPSVRFICRVTPISVQKTGDKRADVHATTGAIHAALEQAIRANPGQWMWAHRRWEA